MAEQDRFRVRAMTEADLPQVMRIERASFRQPWPRRAFEHELGVPFSRSVVAMRPRASATVLGYLVRWHVADEIQLLNLATAREARGLGLGRQLTRGLLEEARERNVRLVTLEFAERNRAARGLYESLGFRVIRRRRDYYAPRNHALVAHWEAS